MRFATTFHPDQFRQWPPGLRSGVGAAGVVEICGGYQLMEGALLDLPSHHVATMETASGVTARARAAATGCAGPVSTDETPRTVSGRSSAFESGDRCASIGSGDVQSPALVTYGASEGSERREAQIASTRSNGVFPKPMHSAMRDSSAIPFVPGCGSKRPVTQTIDRHYHSLDPMAPAVWHVARACARPGETPRPTREDGKSQ
jgi:hypothetical protein